MQPHAEAGDYLAPYAAGVADEVRVYYFPKPIAPWSKPVFLTELGRGMSWRAFFFDPRSGARYDLGVIQDQESWPVPGAPEMHDWVLCWSELLSDQQKSGGRMAPAFLSGYFYLLLPANWLMYSHDRRRQHRATLMRSPPTMRPSWMTMIWSAWRMVLRRWAITKLVRWAISRSSARWMSRSVRVSTELVASSRSGCAGLSRSPVQWRATGGCPG